ncbi:MAG: Hint domain-containing protein [Pseudomonadota bacterium]
MPIYSFAIIQFDDLSGNFSTTNTTGGGISGQTYTVSASAVPIVLTIEDDDNEFDDGYIDPPFNSTSGNNQLLTEPVTVNGTNYGPATSGGTPTDQVELEFGFTTTDGDTYYVVRIDGVNVGLTSGDTLPQPGQTFTIDNGFDGQDEVYEDIPCFTAGTPIDTPDGPRAVETLRPGDLVLTVDDGAQPLSAVAASRISVADLTERPHLRPVEIAPGALGNSDVVRVSPQHGVLVRGARAEMLFGTAEVLVPAKALVGAPGIRQAPLDGPVRYIHLLFERHQLVKSAGLISESFRPSGPISQRLAASAREFVEIFGADAPQATAQPTARPVLRVREGQLLAR